MRAVETHNDPSDVDEGTVLFLGIAYLTNYRSLDLSYMLALDIVLGSSSFAAART